MKKILIIFTSLLTLSLGFVSYLYISERSENSKLQECNITLGEQNLSLIDKSVVDRRRVDLLYNLLAQHSSHKSEGYKLWLRGINADAMFNMEINPYSVFYNSDEAPIAMTAEELLFTPSDYIYPTR